MMLITPNLTFKRSFLILGLKEKTLQKEILERIMIYMMKIINPNAYVATLPHLK